MAVSILIKVPPPMCIRCTIRAAPLPPPRRSRSPEDRCYTITIGVPKKSTAKKVLDVFNTAIYKARAPDPRHSPTHATTTRFRLPAGLGVRNFGPSKIGVIISGVLGFLRIFGLSYFGQWPSDHKKNPQRPPTGHLSWVLSSAEGCGPGAGFV